MTTIRCECALCVEVTHPISRGSNRAQAGVQNLFSRCNCHPEAFMAGMRSDPRLQASV